jgi:hypothetical protein
MNATINELSQEYIVLVHEDGFQGGKMATRKQRSRHFPAGCGQNASRPQIIAQ